MIWTQTRNGNAFNLLHPAVEDINFQEIADTLAGVYRWCGSARRDVSVAMHTLIAVDAAPEALKPYVLLHDAHEAFMGDITTPAQKAIAAIAVELATLGQVKNPERAGRIVEIAIEGLKRRMDTVIFKAANLPMPTKEQSQGIKLADQISLMTERRDFLMPPPRRWDEVLEKIQPLPHRTRLLPKDKAADRLYAAFKKHLPLYN